MRAAILFAAALPLLAGVAGDTSLIEVVKSGNRQAAIELIDQHVNVNAAASDGSTALLWAAHNSDVRIGRRVC